MVTAQREWNQKEVSDKEGTALRHEEVSRVRQVGSRVRVIHHCPGQWVLGVKSGNSFASFPTFWGQLFPDAVKAWLETYTVDVQVLTTEQFQLSFADSCD